jgi:hypothetical protein
MARGEVLPVLATTAESVITSFSLAGFEVALALPYSRTVFGVGLGASGITGMDGFAAPKSVITSLAGFQAIISGGSWLIAEALDLASTAFSSRG